MGPSWVDNVEGLASFLVPTSTSWVKYNPRFTIPVRGIFGPILTLFGAGPRE
jgi:hypothetical protein